MKFKISWPAGIVIALVSFMIFILSFLYKAVFIPKYGHNLVSEDYYKDELNYQQEIDKLNNAAELKQNIILKKVDLGLLISFPSEFEASKIKGTIAFQRLSNDKIDFQLPIDLDTNDLLIPDGKLVDGRWNVKIEWTVNNNKTYLFKEKIMY